MSYKILTKNAIENTNIDGARGEFFNSGNRDGIVKGTLNEGKFFASANNTIALESCELRISGHRVVIDTPITQTFTSKPTSNVRYSFVAQIVVDDNSNVSFSSLIQLSSTKLITDNLFKTTTGAGTYQVEIGKFTLNTDGEIEDIVRTLDVITGGTGGGTGANFEIGNVTTNEIDYTLPAEVDIDKRYDVQQKQTFIDVKIQSPTDFSELDTKVNNAVDTANTAKTNSETAINTANSADTKSDTAVSTANTANTNSQTAIDTANSANTKSESAVTTANSANATATNAENIAKSASEKVDSKVDKVEGKQLSTNDFTNVDKSNLDSNTTARHTHTNKSILDNITASYTTAEQTKLAGLENYNDTEVRQNIADETSARQSADNTLQSNIDTLDGQVVKLGTDQTIPSIKTFSNYIKTPQVASVEGKGLVRYKEAEGKSVYGNDSTGNVLMGNTDRPSYSKSGGDFTGTDLALYSDVTAETSARTLADGQLSDKIDTETTNRTNADTTLQGNIDSEASTREANDTALQTNIDKEATARQNSDASLQSQIGTNSSSISDLQSTKLNSSNANKNVVSGVTVSANDDNVNVVRAYVNLSTQATSSDAETFPLANDTTAGLMSKADYAQIRSNTSRIEQLEGQNVRLTYTASTSPTASQIEAFVKAEGYTDTSKWIYIGVVVSGTNHIWRYYSNTTTWTDIGVDTVNQFTNSIAGIIKGSATAGKVYAETDGTGSVYGWDNLNTSVSNNTTAISDEITNRTNADSTLQTNIDDEKTARESADTNLQSQITTNAENIATNTTNISSKMDKENPTGTGSFSLNRKTGTTIGTNSFAEGFKTTASGSYSHSEGAETTASGLYAHSEGYNTIAQRQSQHTFGEYNIADTQGNTSSRGEYVEIVGNGTAASRSNARTLDWSGNETLAGNLQASGLTDGTTTKTMTEMVGLVDKVATNTTNIANKLEASNIKAGTNITVSTSGNDVTINAETGEGGTNVYVNSVKQDSINFTSDPQTQIDNTVKTTGDQSIAGTKNFTGKIKGSSAYFPNGFGALGTEAIPSFTFSDAVNVGMELGRRDGTAGTPYIDFHTDGSNSTDFNARMLASGNALNITATGGLLVNGTNVGVNSYSNNESGYNGYIRYDNGLQIVWGRVTGNNKTFYYPASFKSNSSYAVSGVTEGWTGSYANYGMSSLTTTSFYLNADKSANWDYLAIGFWK